MSTGLNYEHINIRYALIQAFLIDVEKEVLDISYKTEGKKMTIQAVLLEGHRLSGERINRVKASLPDYEITILELTLTKEQYNESQRVDGIQNYKSMGINLFVKAEVL